MKMARLSNAPFRGMFALLLALSVNAAVAESIDCKVVGVSDGDTLTCLTDAKQQIKVRLAQIDAPEKAQPFGDRSKQALSGLVFGQQVTLERETTDKYGRLVAKVIHGDQDVNLEMVRSGMAWVYDQYARDPEYFAAQDSARSSRTGLWADANPLRPSEWRRGDSSRTAGAAPATAVDSRTVKQTSARGGFTCGSKRTCKEMASCAEARHYLTQCGLSRLDRDGDGVPCESLCR